MIHTLCDTYVNYDVMHIIIYCMHTFYVVLSRLYLSLCIIVLRSSDLVEYIIFCSIELLHFVLESNNKVHLTYTFIDWSDIANTALKLTRLH